MNGGGGDGGGGRSASVGGVGCSVVPLLAAAAGGGSGGASGGVGGARSRFPLPLRGSASAAMRWASDALRSASRSGGVSKSHSANGRSSDAPPRARQRACRRRILEAATESACAIQDGPLKEILAS